MSLAEDIVRQIDIVDYISKVVLLKKNGSNRVGNCPFHKEKTPSFMVSDSKGIFKCFGCGKWGDVITFAMEYERLDFIDALKYLAEHAHIDTTAYTQMRSDPRVKQSKEDTKSLNQEATAHFQKLLHEHPVALAYLQERKIDRSFVDTFQLWYASDSYYDMINHLKKKDFTTEQITESGLCKLGPSGDVYDFFRKRIMFPIWDQVGNVIAFTGRVLDPQDTPKYLNITNIPLYDKSKALYGINFVKKYINEHQKIIVVEWNMDVIWLHRIWLPIGVATCGTSLTHDHIKIIKRHTDHVYFLFDRDDAWFNATVRALKIAYEHDVYPQVLQLTHPIKDIDDFANAWWKADDLLSTACDWLSYIITILIQKYSLLNPVDKKKITTTLFEVIKPIQDMSIVQHYLHLIGEQLGIGEQILLASYKIWYKQNRFGGSSQEQEGQSKKESLDTDQLVEAILQDDAWRQWSNDASLEQLVSFYQQLKELTKRTPSHDTLEWNNYKSMLLWWERELDGLSDDKKTHYIKTLLLKPVDALLKQTIKTHALTPEQKHSLYEQRKQLK